MPNPTDTFATITTILTFIMLVSNFILMVSMWVDKARTPEKSQNQQIADLRRDVNDLIDQRVKDHERIKELEKGNVVTQEALLALLSHAIDGDNATGLTNARNNLQKYLTHKGVSIQ